MTKYTLIAGFILSIFPFGHSLRGLENWLDAIPIFVLWLTFCTTFVMFLLDDYCHHGTLLTIRSRIITNDAWDGKAIHIVIGYQVLFHIMLLFSIPWLEALASLAVLVYFFQRFTE